jgi:hypothetical protein
MTRSAAGRGSRRRVAARDVIAVNGAHEAASGAPFERDFAVGLPERLNCEQLLPE